MQKIFLFLPILFFTSLVQGQISVQRVDSASNPLADSLVRRLAGYGVSVFNVRSNLRQSARSIGTFRSSHPDFPLTAGLVLSTGNLDSIPRPNRLQPASWRIPFTDTVSGCSEGRWLVQKMLQSQTHNGLAWRATEMSTVAFDLIPSGDSLSFRYVFASEEYPEFVCSQFNDLFGFFIKGPGITGDSLFEGSPLAGFQNLARLPQTGLPVSINTVNGGESGDPANAANCRFTTEGMAAFRANSQGSSLSQVFAFDGFTQAMQARVAVQPCQTYQLILVVSDVGDRIYDSGVFLEKGSMVSGRFLAGISGTVPGSGDTIGLCHPVRVGFSRCQAIADRWVLRIKAKASASILSRLALRTPSGLTALPDSVVFEPGQETTSILLETTPGPALNGQVLLQYQISAGGFALSYLDSTRLFVQTRRWKMPQDPALCQYDSLKLTYSGPGSGYFQFQWKEQVDDQLFLPSGLSCPACPQPTLSGDGSSHKLWVLVKNPESECVFYDSVMVTGKPLVRPAISFQTNQFLISEPLPGYQYSWSLNGVWQPDSPGNSLTASPSDSVLLRVQAPNGCVLIQDPIPLITRGARFLPEKTGLILFPNPAVSRVWIESPEDSEVQIFNTQGKLIRKTELFAHQRTEIKDLAPGTYWVQSNEKSGQRYIRSLVVGP